MLKREYVNDLETFVQALFWKSNISTQMNVTKIFQTIIEGTINSKPFYQTAQDLEINHNDFNAILRKLRALGITYTIGRGKGAEIRWSQQFQNRISKISELFAVISGKKNVHQEALDRLNKLVEKTGLTAHPVYEEDVRK